MKKIIVIDDDPMICNMLEEMLNGKYDLAVADTVDEVFKICKQQQIDLIITDLFMPGKSGLDLIEEVKKNYPEIKLLAISGGSRLRKCDFLPIAEVVGANEILYKPFTMTELREKVANLI